jgi:hypothetical protein
MPTSIHVAIPEPCHENWQQMTPNEQGRHCLSCQKTVVDFTFMSDQEILDHISRASTNVCGRFTNDQLNKTYKEQKTGRSFSLRYAWNVVVATFLLTGNAAMAQSKNQVKKKEVVSDRNIKAPEIIMGGMAIVIPGRKIAGQIIDDSTGNPVGFASVRIKGMRTGISANEAGKFEIIPSGKKGKVILIVSAVGYATNEYEVLASKPDLYQIMLIPEAHELKPVVVTARPVMGKIALHTGCSGIKKDTSFLSGRVGGLVVTREVSTAEKVKRTISEWLPKKDVRIYPNPVIPGNSINVSLNLKETGEYKLELMDASGRLVWIQALQVAQKAQVANVPTQSSWSRGIYWLRISNATGKKNYQAKVLLQ